ncbi:MAG: large subunit ribosomal protein L31 [Parcubacteria group bacterium Licking1014_17]|nr:MAG: large subunit ribosomal protein L31 [Parcubacteria group bacterium Licking1014_17]
MKKDIHPTYYETSVKCACGNKWTTGSTVPKISLEICDKCHPFYTGREKFVDKRGRIEKITLRRKKHAELEKTRVPKKPRKTSEKDTK